MAKYWGRESQSIEDVIRNYKNMVYQIAISQTSNQADAEDVFQQIFLIYYSKNKEFMDEEHLKAWLIRTTINCCKKIRSYNWKKRTVPLQDSINDGLRFELEEENHVYQAIMELPEKYKTVILLYYFP